MMTVTDVKPLPLWQDRPDALEPPTVHSSIPDRCRTWVAEETSTRIRYIRRTRLGVGKEPVRPPRKAGAPVRLAAGHRLGPYRLLERLGQGAQGEVWKAVRF